MQLRCAGSMTPADERYVEQLRTTVRVLGRLHEDDVPEPARSALLDAFRAWKTA